jgi:hypothetical protein
VSCASNQSETQVTLATTLRVSTLEMKKSLYLG